ncbi:MAG: beta strand repeat-containing protein [Calditrichota bacterium]
MTARTANGVATTTLYASPTTGSATVSATTGGSVSGQMTVQVVAGPTASVTVTAAADTLYADNHSSTTITAVVRDAYDNPVAQGTPVNFTAQGGTVTGSSTVGTNGIANATFQAGLTSGPAAVTAEQATIQGSAVVYLQATLANAVNLSVNPVQLTADGATQSSLRATVLDVQGRPVSDGTLVTFTANHGSLAGAAAAMIQNDNRNTSRSSKWNGALTATPRNGTRSLDGGAATRDRGSNTLNSLFTTTTVSGYAYATLTSPTVAGTDTATAEVQGIVDREALVYVAGGAARIEVTPATNQLPADGISSTPVLCRVTDAFGNPVGSGFAITISATLGRMNPASGFTNASGEFTSSLITARQYGLSAIVATSEGASGYGEVQFTAPEVHTLGLSGDATSILANGISFATLTARAVDSYGLAVSGIDIIWQLDPGIGELVPVTTVTDTLGRATAMFYSGANRNDVTRTITAIAGTHSANLPLQLRGVTLSAWTTTQYLPADGESMTDVSVLVRETTGGFAITNATVQFAATRGSIVGTAVTNTSGIATVQYRSDRQSGPITISAVYGDTLRAQTSLQLTGTEADTLVVTLGTNELLADGVSSTSVSAVVRNEGGQTVAGVPVSFTANGGGICFPDIVVSDDNGIASSVYQSEALDEDRAISVEVAIERDNDQKPMMLRGVVLDAAATQTTLPANGTATTQIQVDLRRSSSFVAIPNATIQLGTNLGVVPSSATTNASGQATVTFTAGTTAGQANIVVRYGNLLTDTVAVTLFAPVADAVNMAVTQTSLLASGADTSSVTLQVNDQSGAPLRNASVQWSLNGTGTLYYGLTTTDQNGIARNRYTAPASPLDGNNYVIARVGSLVDSTAIATRGVMLTLSPSATNIPANGVSTSVIRAHVRETTSLVAISNAVIHFGSTLGQIPGTATTDASGAASVSLTTGSTAGTATVVGRFGNMLTDTVEVTFYAPTASRVIVAADTSLLYANGVASTPVRALVVDEMDVALPNVTVWWSAVSGLLQTVQTTTNEQGMTSVTYVTTASSNDDIVTITATAGSTMGQTTILERGVTVDVTAVPEMVIADGRSVSQIRAHIYETTTAVAISQAVVTFGTSLGTIPNTAITTTSGIATATLISSTTTGQALVTASYGNILSDQTTVTFAPSTPTTLSLTAAPTVLVADNISTSILTAVLTDQNGNPVPDGSQVRFTIPPQSGSLENLRTTVNGVATNVLTSSTTPDTLWIVAWSEANNSARDSVRVIYRVGAPSIVNLSALSDTLRADGISVDTISAHVTDAVGHPLSNVEVLFSTTIGNITSSRVTDSNGNARVAFSSSQTGTAQITAQAAEAVGNYTLYLIPDNPNSIEMGYFPSSVGVRGSGRNETLLITATVRDANNNPVIDGTEVYFNINNSPGGGDFLSSPGPIPTINGRATVSYNSGTISGSVRIRARCEGISAVSTEILIYAGPPYIESIYSPCDSSHMSLAASPCNMFGMDVVGDSVRIVALVGDRYNNPVTPGTAVYFTTSGGVITTATGYTDSSGFAWVTLFSGNPLPTIARWYNTLHDPNLGGPIMCSAPPTQPGVAKILASTAGVDGNGDSVTVWASTNVIFNYSQPLMFIREVTVNGDPNERTLYIGENALIRIAVYDPDYWPLVSGSTIRCTANHGNTYPNTITAGCPGDTTYTFSFFNNLSLTDDDAASPVLINVDTRFGDAYVFTETFTLRAALPPTP